MMKKILLMLVAAVAMAAGGARAAGGGIAWDKFPTERVTDLAALQNGAKLFANYCLNCHGAEFMRFNRLRDIGLTEEQIAANLVFTGAKVGDTMKVALSAKDGKAWFGAQPPDLSVIARSRSAVGMGSGADYIYTFLRTYHRDDTKATGWNNAAFPNVGMPHVLWELQATQSQTQYNDTVADLVAYLQWMSEPVQTDRVRLGVWVLLFLGLFTVIAWRLNAAFWKDVK
jgi:ubiquinol-cytochrome c reductase cytochrome c1 subunit